MNLTELIRLNNRLSEMTVTDLQQTTSNRVDLVMDQIDVPLAGVDKSFQQRLVEKNLILQQSFSSFEQELSALKQEVQKHIEHEGTAWLQRSYTVYEQQINSRSAQSLDALKLHRNKPTRIDLEVEKILTFSKKYAKSKYF